MKFMYGQGASEIEYSIEDALEELASTEQYNDLFQQDMILEKAGMNIS